MTPRLLLLLLLFYSAAFAQDKKALEERAQQMYDYAVKGDFKSVVEYFYPKNFEVNSKKSVIASMNGKTPEFTRTIKNVPPDFKFGEIKKIGDAYYCVLYHKQHIEFVLKDKVKKDERDMIVQMYKGSVSADKASFDAKTNTVTTEQRTMLIAIADQYSGYVWTFGVFPDAAVQKELGL